MSGSATTASAPDPAPSAVVLADAAAFRAASVAEQTAALTALAPPERAPWLLLLDDDPRQGSRQLASRLRREAVRHAAREARWAELAAFDRHEAAGQRLAGASVRPD